IVALWWSFWQRTSTSEQFMAAGRSLPGWAVGLSVFGSYISSISFLANPGKAFADNWNPAVFALAMPLAAWIAARWFVPFYRQAGEVSAYQHLEHRFGPWARTYAVVCFLLVQLARLGTILYLLALALSPLLGVNIPAIIVVVGIVVTIYPLLGGTEAWIWAGVIQAVVLVLGAAICLGALLLGMPGGPVETARLAAAEGKFSLGSFGPNLAESTFWVVLVYGFVTHLQNFGIDQSYVQRYITADSDQAARRSVWLGTWLFMPVSVVFFLIGTALWAFYQGHPDRLPTGLDATARPDAVFPHFIATELPPGLTGLVIAAICAAAMDSNLNCCATLVLCDLYRRYFRPQASERESLWVLRLSTLAMGALGTGAGLAMLSARSALDVWWQLAGILSGGILGLFLLGLISPRVRSGAALAGVAAGVVLILWMTFSPSPTLWPWPILRSPFHGLLTLVFGTVTVLLVGLVGGLFTTTRIAPPDIDGPKP
ncbi:MAG: sodium:solute symporter, partial [Pirellulaceae bacterium]